MDALSSQVNVLNKELQELDTKLEKLYEKLLDEVDDERKKIRRQQINGLEQIQKDLTSQRNDLQLKLSIEGMQQPAFLFNLQSPTPQTV